MALNDHTVRYALVVWNQKKLTHNYADHHQRLVLAKISRVFVHPCSGASLALTVDVKAGDRCAFR